MRITTRLVVDMATGQVLEHESYEYEGPVAICSGPSQEQKETYAKQSEFYDTLTSEYNTLFGENQNILNSLTTVYKPMFEAGPNQEGMSPAEKTTLTSQAIEGTAKTYQQAQQALGSQIASQNGGGEVLPSGANDQLKESLAASAAGNESSKLLDIENENFALGHQNWETAAQGLGEESQLINPEGQAGQATGAGNAAATTANEITQADNSWEGMVGGILGGAAGAATSFGLGKLPGGHQ